MAEKVMAAGHEFEAAFVQFLEGGGHTNAVSHANDLATSIEQLLLNTKGASRLATNDDDSEKIMSSSRDAGRAACDLFDQLGMRKLGVVEHSQQPAHVRRHGQAVVAQVQELMRAVEHLIPKTGAGLTAADDLSDVVEREMHEAARAIDDAAARLLALINAKPRDDTSPMLSVHGAILDSAMAITNAIGRLIRAATDTQKEIVANGRGTNSATQFYKKNHRWTEGLISAAKAVALATMMLVEAADGVVRGTHTMEQLAVASEQVSAATMQLVVASRVKADRGSKTLTQLELAAQAVNDATKNLVRAAKLYAQRQEDDAQRIDITRLTPHELKVREMEQQVRILKLETELSAARKNLGDMRRTTYHAPDGLQ